MPHKRSTQGSGGSFESLPPETLGRWKGPEKPTSYEKRNRHRRRLRLFIGGLLVVLLAGLGVHIAWKASTPLPSIDDHNASTTKDQLPSSDTLSGALSFKNSQNPKDSEIRLAPAGAIPSSMYASTLDSVRVTLDEGKEAEAEAKLKTLPKEALNDRQVQKYAAVLWNNLGVKQRGKGMGSGMAAFKTALVIDQTQPEAYRNLGRLYTELKDPDLTREFLEKAISVVPDDPWLQLALAESFCNRDDFGAASRHLEQAADLVPRYPDVQSGVKAPSSTSTGGRPPGLDSDVAQCRAGDAIGRRSPARHSGVEPRRGAVDPLTVP